MSRLILFVLILTGFSVSAQKPLKDFYLKRSLKQNNLQFQFTVLDEDKRGIWHYNKHKFYYWYKAQKVMSTQAGSSGILLHGTFEAFYPNKQLSNKGYFKRGLKHGKWMYWREDGTLCRIEQWVNGLQRGEQLFFDEKGVQNESIDMSRLGSHRKVADSLVVSDNDGVKQRLTIYNDRNEVIRTECKKHGVLHGKVVHYENGKKVRTEKYRNGELVEGEEGRKVIDESDKRKEESSERKEEGEKNEDGWWNKLKPKFHRDKVKKDKEESKPKKEKNEG